MIEVIRKYSVFCLLLVSLIFAGLQPVLAQEPVITTFWVQRGANIRSEPTTAGGESTIIATAARGEQLSVVDEVVGEIPTGWQDNDIWYIVQLSDDEIGYVYSALIAQIAPPQQGIDDNESSVENEPLITGSDSFKIKIRAALRLLRDRDPDSYDFVNEWLDGIIQGFYTCKRVRREPVASIGMACMRYRSILAVVLVHEACHVMRSTMGFISGGLVGERACLGMEIEALQIVDPHHYLLPRAQQLHRNIEESVCQWWTYTFNKTLCFALP